MATKHQQDGEIELKAAVCQTASSNWLSVAFEGTQRWRHLLVKDIAARYLVKPPQRSLGELTNPFIL